MRYALILLLTLVGFLSFSACSEPSPTPTPIERQVTFKVEARQIYEVAIDLKPGTEVTYSFTADLDVNFRVIDPYDNVLRQASRVESANGGFVARDEGRHRLIFDNTYSLVTAKTVDLEYQLKPSG